ncbi:uncharacterized protein EHS24_003309 [Apiotrichum porosum]|uniref:Pre-mRNA-splicing factor 38 n=1 Tax=Apiotrichum porosum TaxID=105984 RepID=A0A427XEL2_9TREE|nr:uncharacterized protein EHS24_003309 [Apiotrichum porosum]RSH77349.1 hypothetical protein EHS24_003309 [Apiotrichum porosum]
MATTARGTNTVHGQDPQNLIEKVIRARIYESTYWKEHCFALTAESIIDKAIALHAIGGVYERQTPTPFMCLLLRLLQLQPEKEILFEYLLAEEFKYLRALAVIYIRLTFRSMEVFQILEPLMADYRKLRYREPGGDSEDEGEVGDTRRFVSRSPSLSPDRVVAGDDEDKLEGDV